MQLKAAMPTGRWLWAWGWGCVWGDIGGWCWNPLRKTGESFDEQNRNMFSSILLFLELPGMTFKQMSQNDAMSEFLHAIPF